MQNETAGSILEKAANKENYTYLLYKYLIGYVKGIQTRAILEKLAAEKLRHKQVLENYNTVPFNKKEIKDMSKNGIPEYFAEESSDESFEFKDVIISAVKKEKMAYEFYRNMSKVVEDRDLKRLFKWLSKEESKNIKDIEALLGKVM